MNKKILQALAWLVLIIGLIAAGCAFGQNIEFRPALTAQAPAWGVGRAETHIGGYLSPVCREDGYHSIAEYTEGEGEPPEWYRPDEEMAVEWVDHFVEADEMVDGDGVTDINVGDINVHCNKLATNLQPDSVDYIAHPPIGIDPGGVDWNLCTDLFGWDGHRAEAWELDLLARVFYLEFWGTSLPCSEAGCDAILNLWASGKYGRTLFEALSYYDPQYGYTYRVYPRVWETTYDADGLAWCREFCKERFLNGPEWSAVYFQLGGYHDTDWVPPLYEMDGVYFSGKGWQ